jgi:hypothetical protein
MTIQMPPTQPLNDVQMMLLRLFSRPVENIDLENIQEMLIRYYESALQDELDKVIQEKAINRVDFDKILNKQQRTK